jgi:hypothetical protein
LFCFLQFSTVYPTRCAEEGKTFVRSEILMVRLLGEQANQLARVFTAFTHDEKQEAVSGKRAVEKLFSSPPGLSENVTRRLENSIDCYLLGVVMKDIDSLRGSCTQSIRNAKSH